MRVSAEFAALGGQIADLLQSQNVIFIMRCCGLAHVLNNLAVGIQVRS